MANGARCEVFQNTRGEIDLKLLTLRLSEQTEFYHNNSTVINVSHNYVPHYFQSLFISQADRMLWPQLLFCKKVLQLTCADGRTRRRAKSLTISSVPRTRKSMLA